MLYYTPRTISWEGANIHLEGNEVLYTPNSNGNGGLDGTSNSQEIFIPAGTTLTFSQEYISGSSWTSGQLVNNLRLYRKDNTFKLVSIGDFTTGNYTVKHKVTYTTTEDYYSIRTYAMMYTVRGMTTPMKYRVQLEIGNSATDFEEYQEQEQLLSLGSIELAKIGNYTDKLFKAVQGNSIYDSLDSTTKASLTVGKWYKEENIKKYPLNGTEAGWTLASNNTDTTRFYKGFADIIRGGTSDTAPSLVLCNYFSTVTFRVMYNNDIEGISQYGGVQDSVAYNIYFRISNSKATTVDTWKTWLSNNTPTVYFVRATPTYTEITDNTLLGQLEELLKKRTNKNVTNISIVPTGTNAEPTAEVEYRQDLQTVIGNINNAIISLGGNV